MHTRSDAQEPLPVTFSSDMCERGPARLIQTNDYGPVLALNVSHQRLWPCFGPECVTQCKREVQQILCLLRACPGTCQLAANNEHHHFPADLCAIQSVGCAVSTLLLSTTTGAAQTNKSGGVCLHTQSKTMCSGDCAELQCSSKPVTHSPAGQDAWALSAYTRLLNCQLMVQWPGVPP